jgi:trigger factor
LERTVSLLEGSKREVQIYLTEADLAPHYRNAYERAQAEISLPGFRKGKVPISVIRQRMGREIEAGALETIADEEFRAFATSENVRVVGHPALVDIKKEAGGVGFVIEYEVLPEVQVTNYRGLVIDRPVREVTDEDVQNEIDRICLRAASFESAEQVTDQLFVVAVTMHELDKETSMPIIGAEAKEQRVFLDDDEVDMHLRNSLSNAAVGASFTYVAETDDANAQPPSYRVTVSDIQKVVPAELTDELVEKLTGGNLHTPDELREDIRLQLGNYFDNASRESMENQIVNQLVQAHDFDVPESLVHAVVHQLFDDFKARNEGAPGLDKLTAHDLEHEFRPAAERIAKWELIRQQIIAAEELTLADEDVEVAASKYGLEADQLRMAMRQNRGLADQLMAEKTMRTLLDYAIVNDVIVPANS